MKQLNTPKTTPFAETPRRRRPELFGACQTRRSCRAAS